MEPLQNPKKVVQGMGQKLSLDVNHFHTALKKDASSDFLGNQFFEQAATMAAWKWTKKP